jgi:hypothetical protein
MVVARDFENVAGSTLAGTCNKAAGVRGQPLWSRPQSKATGGFWSDEAGSEFRREEAHTALPAFGESQYQAAPPLPDVTEITASACVSDPGGRTSMPFAVRASSKDAPSWAGGEPVRATVQAPVATADGASCD